MALYRLHILRQPADPKTVAGLLTIWKNVSDPILDMQLDYTIPVLLLLFQNLQCHYRLGVLEK